jgi:hypothetical protein
MAEWKKVIVSGSNASLLTVTASAVTIGTAEDGTYTDGLYTDFTNMTPVGTVVDRFNEILKGLSPPPAPQLTNLEVTASTGTNNLRLAFGASQSTSSYQNVVGTGSLTAIDFKGIYTRETGSGGGFIRLGTFATATNLVAILNENVAANGTPFINYPSNSFDATNQLTGISEYTIEINGSPYLDFMNDTASFSGTYFDLTKITSGSFPSTGLPFDIFYHRQGSVRIPQSAWTNGWNYAKVKNNRNNVTNYIDWIFDPAASPASSSYVFNNFTTSSINASGVKWLSGVPYLTAFSYNVTGSVTNYYKNTYNTTALPFSSVSAGVTATSATIADPVTADSLLQVNATHTLAATGRRVLGAGLSSTLAITNAFSKTGNTGAITTQTMLLDNTNTANTALQENFCLENYRLDPTNNYDSQGAVTSDLGTFPSSSTLAGTENLLVYNGGVRYVTQGLNGGNFLGAGVVYDTGDTLPDYSSESGEKWYYRGFQNGSNADATFNLGITGTNVSFIPFGGTLSGNNVKVWIKIPGKTGWRDISTDAPASTSGIALNDNVGARTGAQPSNLGAGGGTATFAIDLKTEGLLPNEYFVVRLTTADTWAGSISQINITGL